jgi:uncharacterized protein YdaU (DUF1376 family)
MADLTRFDFNAYNFLNSEAVEAMTAEEVGQYLLLLVRSWLIAKGASLPDDPDLLAKWARCKRVSDKVMAKFPVVETEFGPRRRNSVIYMEWLRTVERHEAAVELGRKGGMSTSINKIEASRLNGQFGGRPRNPSETQADNPTEPKQDTQAQSNPNQAVPNQSNQSNGAGDFKNLAIRYRRAFAVRLSGSKNVRQRYAEACRTYGETTVLEMFDSWSTTAGWIKDWAAEGKLRTDGLKGFYESLPEQIEIETAAKTEQVAAQSAVSDREADIQRQLAESHAKFVEQQQKVREEIDEEEAAALRIKRDPAGFFGQTK